MRQVTSSAYRNLKINYGKWASWAVWNPQQLNDLRIFEPRGIQHPFLRADLVYIALNAAQETVDPWQAFHVMGGKSRDHRFAYIANNAVWGGGYITDLIKGFICKNSAEVERHVKADENLARTNAATLCEELQTLGAGQDTLFVVFGASTKRLIEWMIEQGWLPCIAGKMIYIPHYSHAFSNAAWNKMLKQYADRIL